MDDPVRPTSGQLERLVHYWSTHLGRLSVLVPDQPVRALLLFLFLSFSKPAPSFIPSHLPRQQQRTTDNLPLSLSQVSIAAWLFWQP